MPRLPLNQSGTVSLGDEDALEFSQQAAWDTQNHFSTTYPVRDSQISPDLACDSFWLPKKSLHPQAQSVLGPDKQQVLVLILQGLASLRPCDFSRSADTEADKFGVRTNRKKPYIRFAFADPLHLVTSAFQLIRDWSLDRYEGSGPLLFFNPVSDYG